MKILIVDDIDSNRQLLSYMVEDLGHEFATADNGLEAIKLCSEVSPDLILMDVMMPVMDGLEAATKIKAQSTQHVPIIFLTAMTEQEALIECLDAGGDDFITKPVHEPVLQAKINVHVRLVEMTQQLSEKNRQLERYHLENEREQEVAEVVMQGATRPAGYESQNTSIVQSAASKFNGDIFLSARTPTGGQLMVLGDFTGHGLAASIGGIPLSRVFFQEAARGASVGEIAQRINTELLDFLPDNMFCAATIIEQNCHGDELIVWSGGLPNSFIYSGESTFKRAIESQHMPLGVLEEYEFEDDVEHIQLAERDYVILFTDGIVESCNPQGDMFGEERLMAYLDRTPDFKPNDFCSYLTQWIGVDIQEDDISLVVLTALPLQDRLSTKLS